MTMETLKAPKLSVRATVGDKHANIMDVRINGVLYEYRPPNDAESFAKKVNNMAIHSAGKALQYVKNTCTLLSKKEAVCYNQKSQED